MSEFSAGHNKRIHIDGLTHDGRGIAVIGGKKSFISGALPGEMVEYRLHHRRAQYNEGTTVSVVQASPERIQPECPHFGVCGGCSVQYMSDAQQVEYKQKTVLDQLRRFGRVTPNYLLDPLSDDRWGYRRKARLGVKFVPKTKQLLLGFREKSSRSVTDTPHCLTLHPQAGKQLAALSELVLSLSICAHVTHIEFSMGDESQALIFRCLQACTCEDREKLIRFGAMHSFDIYVEPNPPEAIEQLHTQFGSFRLNYRLPEFDLEFLFHPKEFTQVNASMNRKMVSQAVRLLELTPEDVVLDLFCGIGNFTLPMARYAKEVVGIEGSEEMVARAHENANHNHITNVRVHALNLQSEHATFSSHMKRPYTKVLLDPPRAGAKEILNLFLNPSIIRILYVSCNPSTLARDVGELVHQYGFTLQSCGILNMFPHTSHVESIAVLDRGRQLK